MVTGSCTSVRESWQNNCNKTYEKIETIWGRTFFGIKILKQEFSARQIQRITNVSSGVIARL